MVRNDLEKHSLQKNGYRRFVINCDNGIKTMYIIGTLENVVEEMRIFFENTLINNDILSFDDLKKKYHIMVCVK